MGEFPPYDFVKPIESALQCSAEQSFLALERLHDQFPAFVEFWIEVAHGLQHALENSVEKWFLKPEDKLSFENGPSDQPAQNISSPRVSGKDPVDDAENRGSNVIGDDPEGFVPIGIDAIPRIIRDRLDLAQNGLE